MPEQTKGFISNVLASATWDGIKQLWGPAVLAVIVALWQKLKHGSLDWLAIVGMFLVACLLAFLNFRKSNKSARPTVEPLAEKAPVPKEIKAGSDFDKFAAEDSAEMWKRIVLCGVHAKLNTDSVEPCLDIVFRIVNASMFHIMSDGVEGNAYYRGYNHEKCYLSRTPVIADDLNFFSLARGKLGELRIRQFVPLQITDNIASGSGRLKIYFDEVRFKFRFPGIAGKTEFIWFGDEVEVFFPENNQGEPND